MVNRNSNESVMKKIVERDSVIIETKNGKVRELVEFKRIKDIPITGCPEGYYTELVNTIADSMCNDNISLTVVEANFDVIKIIALRGKDYKGLWRAQFSKSLLNTLAEVVPDAKDKNRYAVKSENGKYSFLRTNKKVIYEAKGNPSDFEWTNI